MDILNEIENTNRKLGLNTFFYNDENGVLGYSEDDNIFLNTYYVNDIEMVNKHEVLHFYSQSNRFKFIKELFFNLIGESDLEKIKDAYYLKYYSLYSKEEIENGILDEEIIIDFIIDNGHFPVNINDYVKDAYSFIVNKEEKIKLSSEGKKYLNITLSKKIDQQFPRLNKWEKLFVLNYYNGKDKVLPFNKNTKHEEVRMHIKNELQKLYDYANEYSNFVVDYKSEEIKRKLDIQIKKYIQEGDIDGANYIKNNYEMNLKNIASIISNNLQKEYKNIVEELKKKNYDDAFKFLMLKETIDRVYKKDFSKDGVQTIVDKRIKNTSISSHMTLNVTVLDEIYNNVDKYDRFVDLYFEGLEIFNIKVKKENEVHFENINTYNKGKWIKFEGKLNDEKGYINNAQRLTALVKDTVWCTKDFASSHLEKGDYYVFIDNNGAPHIAIRMIGDEISEVRGIANGKAQEIEEEYRDVTLEFLENNTNIKHGREWLEKEEWNKRLVDYANKLKQGLLEEINIEKLIYDITQVNDYKIHFSQNSNKKVLIDLIKDNKEISEAIARKYNCDVKDIHFGDISNISRYKEFFPYVIVIGSVNFYEAGNNMDFSKLKYIFGDTILEDSIVSDLPNLEEISGDLRLMNSKIKELPRLKRIGGRTSTFSSKMEKMNELEYIGGDAFFYSSNILELNSLSFIGGNANFAMTGLTGVNNLKIVRGNIIIKQSFIENLESLEYVGGNADFGYSKLAILNPNCCIKGKVNLNNCPLENKGIKR